MRSHLVEDREQESPSDEREETVRDRIGVERQIQKRVARWRERDVLRAEQEEDRPQEIRERGRGDEGAEGRPRRDTLGGEGDGVMADEQRDLA